MTDTLADTIEAPAPTTPVDRAQLTPRERERPALLSVVCPACNEADALERFHARATAVLQGLGQPFELVYVNDGSADATLGLMLALRAKEPTTTVVDLSRSFGREIALTAGLEAAQGDAAVLMAADLSTPPEALKEMIAAWREGYDIVRARPPRGRAPSLKARLAGALGSDVGERPEFALLSRKAVEGVKRLRERRRKTRELLGWLGFPTKLVLHEAPSEPAPEISLRREGRGFWERLATSRISPLRAAAGLGYAIAATGTVIAALLTIGALFGAPIGFAGSLLAAVALFAGAQLVLLGVVGEYVGRIHEETRGRPLYVVNAVHVARFEKSSGDRRTAVDALAAAAREKAPKALPESLSV